MAKKNMNGRKPGGAAGIAVIEDSDESNETPEIASDETHEVEATPKKPKKKATEDQSSNGNVGIADIRKAATFANSVGGLDKAIALLQILKVAKEVQ